MFTLADLAQPITTPQNDGTPLAETLRTPLRSPYTGSMTAMAEDAFERFRRLRDVAPLGTMHVQAQETEAKAPLSPLALLHQLHTLGVVLTPYPDGMVRHKAPQGMLTPALVDAMHQHKAELHAMMETFEERAAILEYSAALPRAEAERLTWACVLGEAAAYAVPVGELSP